MFHAGATAWNWRTERTLIVSLVSVTREDDEGGEEMRRGVLSDGRGEARVKM